MTILNRTDKEALKYLKEHGETSGAILYQMFGVFGKRFYHPKDFIKMLEKSGYVDSKLGEMGESVVYLTERGKSFLK
jgi:hypothetical protein